jgi:cell division protein FtsL
MKLTGADLPRLQLSLLAALLMIASGAGSVYLALKSTRQARFEQAAAQKERNDVDAKLKQVRSEEAEIKQKSAVFNKLEARGVIGEEQRLEWVELLKAIRERRRLLDLQYEIAPQRVLAPTPGSSLAFYASTMKLELKLLHEEDLTRLLGDLRQQARALIQVRSCNVWRLPRNAGESAASAQLQAACEIDWITLHQVPATGSTR